MDVLHECFVYVLQDADLVPRASKTLRPDVADRLKLHVGQGITGWVAEHREPVAVAQHASEDPRFQSFHELPGDRHEERKLVDRAKAVLQRDLGITEGEAYLSIQKQSRQRRRSKKDIAETIVLSDEMRPAREGS